MILFLLIVLFVAAVSCKLLPKASIKKPVTTIMIYVGALLLGIICWSRLPQELFPPITYPQLTVVTYYKDAAPEEIEILITKPIEEAIGTVSGVKEISSTSKEELSLVVAEFNWGQNMDFAALGMREKIDIIKEKLPRGSEEPIVMKYNPFELPIAVLNITGKKPSRELLHISKRLIKPELEKIDGVASCALSGGRDREILIEIDQGRLAAQGISIVSVADALKKTNLNYPAGTIKETFYEYLIRTIGEFEVVSEIGKVPVSSPKEEKSPEEFLKEDFEEKQKTSLILLKDIARVKDTIKEKESESRYNGADTISISIQKMAGANTLQVVNRVKKKIKEISSGLPKEISIDIAYDQSQFIKEAVNGVKDAAIQGGVLAFFVLLFFLRNFGPSLIVSATIPISVIVTFALMYFGNISLNMISLGGLALGVGMLVDAAIVVVENIFRQRQEGKDIVNASIDGSSEVSAAIAGTVLTTVAVFLPMVFVIGVAGQIFKELAYTVSFSLTISLFAAMTLVPLLASNKRLSGKIKKENTGVPKLDKMEESYSNALKKFLSKKKTGLILVLFIFLVSLFILFKLDREFLPKVDQGQFVINVTLSPGAKLEVTNLAAKQIEEVLMSYKEVKSVTVNVGSSKEKELGKILETLGSHQARLIVDLKRKASTDLIIQRLKRDLEKKQMRGLEIEYLLQESVFKTAFQAQSPIVVEVKGEDINTLRTLAGLIKEKMSNINGITEIKDSIIEPSPETKVHINKDKAAMYNLSVSDIALTAQTAIEGYVATEFKKEGEEIDVKVRLREGDRDDLSKIRQLVVHSPLGVDVPLAEVAYFVKGKGPTEIKRKDQERVVFIYARTFKRALSDCIKDVDGAIKDIKLSSGYSINLTGENQQMQESFGSLQFALILAIILVYMIMAAQFESLWQPFIIMFTIPLSLIGVAIGLFITNTPMSVMVILGVIVLGGVVVDNGIVLVDCLNNLRSQGISLEEAVVKASWMRVRPILMTAMTTVLGLLPLALGINEGSQIQVPMAITIMGGLLFATFLSLFVVPSLYHIGANIIEKEKPVEKKEEIPVQIIEEKPAEIIYAPPPEEKPKEEIPKKEEVIKEGETDMLIEREEKLIQYLKENKRITRTKYAEIFSVSIPTAARDMKALIDKGLLEAKGPVGRGRYYILKG